jgi:hypothetical protein
MDYSHEQVSNQDFCVGGISGTDIDGYIFQPFRVIDGKHYHASHYGRRFKDTWEASRFSLLYGYSQPYYRRLWCDACKCVHSFLKQDCPNRWKHQR